MKYITRIILIVAAVSSLAATAQAQFTINWFTLDDGGGPSSGGTFTLHGTVGQSDAGPMSGGALTVSGGFWSRITEAAPRLSIRLAGAGAVILSWPSSSTGFALHETSSLTVPGGWMVVPQTPVINGANLEVTLPVTGQSRLFRLRKL